MEKQNGRFDLVGVPRRRALGNMRPGADKITRHAEVHIAAIFFLQSSKIRHGRNSDDCLEQLRVEHRGLKRRISAIGPAHDRKLVWRCNPLGNQPPAAVIDVGNGGLPGLKTILLVPAVAIAGRATVIGLENGETLIRKILGEPVKAPFITRAWSAMRHDNGG